jgi:hypothetical protein
MREKNIPPNQVLQRTASQPAIHFLCVCHRPLDCESRFSRLTIADLVSR